MDRSLDEIGALAKRAARGAGYPWGLAEEAAWIARWLCARDVDAAAALASLLPQIDGRALADWTPDAAGRAWRSRGESLCPIVTGAALADRAGMLATGEITLHGVAAPTLLIPFAGAIARRIDAPVSLSMDGVEATADAARLSFEADPPEAAETVILSAGGRILEPRPHRARARPSQDALATLDRFAHRTYAPATAESRLKGAGAGLSDND